MKHATVVGAAGFIGRALSQHLRGQGFEVHEAARDHQRWLDGPLGHVFYCAGLTADYAQRPHDAVQAHVVAAQRRAADGPIRFAGVPVVDASVRRLAGRRAQTKPRALALDPRQPRHLYDLSKALGESLCQAAGGGRARVARLSCVYRDADDADGFLPQLLRGVPQALAMAESATPPRLHIDTTLHATRDYVHLDDVLAALVLIATRGTQPLYNVASGRNLSNRELFARLRELSGCEIVAQRQHMARPSPRIDISRLRREFAWRPGCLLDKLADLLPAQALC